MFSRFFIDRPIFAIVISTFLILAGLAAMRSLPIAQYPEIAPPVVTVQAVYPSVGDDAGADRRFADRERDQWRAGHDLHELVVAIQRHRANPGDVRHRHQRRHRRGERQQPRHKQVEPRLPRKCAVRA
jgi:hypothetical protein